MAKKAKSRHYVCTTKCWYQRRLFSVGDLMDSDLPEKEIPKHFTPRKEFKPVEEKLPDEPKTLKEITPAADKLLG
jgi:hypothetical protein